MQRRRPFVGTTAADQPNGNQRHHHTTDLARTQRFADHPTSHHRNNGGHHRSNWRHDGHRASGKGRVKQQQTGLAESTAKRADEERSATQRSADDEQTRDQNQHSDRLCSCSHRRSWCKPRTPPSCIVSKAVHKRASQREQDRHVSSLKLM